MAASNQSRRRTWPIDTLGQKYLAVRVEDLKPTDQPMSGPATESAIQRAISHPNDIGQLIQLSQALRGSGRIGGNVSLRALLWAFQTGEFALLRRRDNAPNLYVKAAEPGTDQVKMAKEVKTWVEIEVVDMEGNPFSNKPYLCVLPDGRVQEGVLDHTGCVRFEGIDPGNCVFVLTDLDREAWDRVA